MIDRILDDWQQDLAARMNTESQLDSVVCVRGNSDMELGCIVCKDVITRNETSVTCKSCYSRSKTTWRSHVQCWIDWQPRTCFFCQKQLFFLNHKNRRRKARQVTARNRRVRFLTEAIMVFFGIMILTCFLSWTFFCVSLVTTFWLSSYNHLVYFYTFLFGLLVRLVCALKRRHFLAVVRAEIRVKHRVRQIVRAYLR